MGTPNALTYSSILDPSVHQAMKPSLNLGLGRTKNVQLQLNSIRAYIPSTHLLTNKSKLCDKYQKIVVLLSRDIIYLTFYSHTIINEAKICTEKMLKNKALMHVFNKLCEVPQGTTLGTSCFYSSTAIQEALMTVFNKLCRVPQGQILGTSSTILQYLHYTLHK